MADDGWVDVVAAASRALTLEDHSRLTATCLHDGGGWISRDGAVAFARRLLLAAGVSEADAIQAKAAKEGYTTGYAQGWAHCLAHVRIDRELQQHKRPRAVLRHGRSRTEAAS